MALCEMSLQGNLATMNEQICVFILRLQENLHDHLFRGSLFLLDLG
jgi:hypothetical protein